MRSSVELWSVPPDSGVVGQHILRGPLVRPGVLFYHVILYPVLAFTFGAGCTLDFGTQLLPTLFFSGIDPTFFTAGTVFTSTTPGGGPPYYGVPDYFTVSVNGADVTAGELELLVETVRL
jgi:hypothetical protein